MFKENTPTATTPESKKTSHKKFEPSTVMKLTTALEMIDLDIPRKPRLWGKLARMGQLGMIAGARGKGKTWLSMSLAVAMSNASQFLGHRLKRSMRVIYLDGEMDGKTVQQRLQTIAMGQGVELNENLRLFTPDTYLGLLPCINRDDDQKKIDQLIGQDWDVLFIDNYSVWSFDGDESASSFQPFLRWLISKKRMGKTVIFVHHTGKNGKQRGSSKHEDALDFSISLKPITEPSKKSALQFTLHWEKLRHLPTSQAPTIKVSMRVLKERGVVWKHKVIKGDGSQKSRAVQMRRDGMSNADIARALERNPSTVSRWLS
jgi:hypothetical protein